MVKYTASHWGVYEIAQRADGPELTPWHGDPDPADFGAAALAANDAHERVRRPAVRSSWLARVRSGKTPLGPALDPSQRRRGSDPFVDISWEEAVALSTSAMRHTIDTKGNRAIFGGSYGWASAGRFHHAQSQLHRFLNVNGGYVRSVNSYSLGVATPLLPHIFAPLSATMAAHDRWPVVAEHTRLFVSFGGVPRKNAQIESGGVLRHDVYEGLAALSAAGARIVNFSPTADDLRIAGKDGNHLDGNVEWIPIRPNTDVAVMLALMHTIIDNARADHAFLKSHCTGFDTLRDYILGRQDGVVKHAAWAEHISGVPAKRIVRLATDLVATRSLVNIAWSLQRAHHGEQPFWALIALAAVIGQIGLPGGGFALGYGTTNAIGRRPTRFTGPTFPQGQNPIKEFIPVARIGDMLRHPGAPFAYNGSHFTYPKIDLIYWAGGNPFHHHQDLHALSDAWQNPSTIIVHEQVWNATAHMADIVLPATTTLERTDIGYASNGGHMVAMQPAVPPVGEALDDHEIFRRLSVALGNEAAFTEGRTSSEWLAWMYDRSRQDAQQAGIALPNYAAFLEAGLLLFEDAEDETSFIRAFRQDPVESPLPTPSGKIELFSATIAGFGLEDCPGHPVWLTPAEYLGEAGTAMQVSSSDQYEAYPFHLISDQPATRLHSQYAHAALSQAARINGLERVDINRHDAEKLGIEDRSAVCVSNARGSLLATACLREDIASRVLRMSTGAWFETHLGHESAQRSGNPNVLTADRSASSFSQGCSAQTCRVQLTKHTPA